MCIYVDWAVSGNVAKKSPTSILFPTEHLKGIWTRKKRLRESVATDCKLWKQILILNMWEMIWIYWNGFEYVPTDSKSVYFVFSISYVIFKLNNDNAYMLTSPNIKHEIQTRKHDRTMLSQCWPTIYDADPALDQHWRNVSWLPW